MRIYSVDLLIELMPYLENGNPYYSACKLVAENYNISNGVIYVDTSKLKAGYKYRVYITDKISYTRLQSMLFEAYK